MFTPLWSWRFALRAPVTPAEQFIVAVRKQGKPIGQRYESGIYLLGGDAAVELVLDDDDAVYLQRIRTYSRGKGIGSQALKLLTKLADDYQVTLRLWVDPFDSKTLSEDELMQWYGRHGFKHLDRYNMERRPGTMRTSSFQRTSAFTLLAMETRRARRRRLALKEERLKWDEQDQRAAEEKLDQFKELSVALAEHSKDFKVTSLKSLVGFMRNVVPLVDKLKKITQSF